MNPRESATSEPTTSRRSIPTVTLVVAVRDERPFIERCLLSCAEQRYPAEHLEILVYDGGSTDGSRELAEAVATDHPNIAVFDNPRRTQAAAWNQGILRARGDIVGIVSGHAELDPGYVEAGVETLERTGADMVGGPVRADSDGSVGRAVALATTSPFGVGGARFHYTDREEDVDTVYMGICRTEVYRGLLFDEDMVRNQDDELSYRLLDRGGRIVCNPAIRSRYRNRATLRSLARQYWDYGYWKIRVAEKHPRQIRPRHLVPSIFVCALVGGATLAAVLSPARAGLVALGGLYAAVTAGASIWTTRRAGLRLAPLVATAYVVLHTSYGLGFLAGLGTAAIRRVTRGTRREAIGTEGPPG